MTLEYFCFLAALFCVGVIVSGLWDRALAVIERWWVERRCGRALKNWLE